MFNRDWNCGSNLKFIRKEHSRSFTDSNSPYEFNQLENREHVKQALTSYDIVGVVGTNKPRQELAPFISLEELISGAGTAVLLSWLKEELDEEMIAYVNNQLVRNFSLDRVIQSVTILDTEKVISQMEFFVGIWNVYGSKESLMTASLRCLSIQVV